MTARLGQQLSDSTHVQISDILGDDARLTIKLLEASLPYVRARHRPKLSASDKRTRNKQERAAWRRVRRALDTLARDLSRPEIDARLAMAEWSHPKDWRAWKLALPRLRGHAKRATGRPPEAFRLDIGQVVSAVFQCVGIRRTKSREGKLGQVFRVLCEDFNVRAPDEWETATLTEIIQLGKTRLLTRMKHVPGFRAKFATLRYGRGRPLVMDEFLFIPRAKGGKSDRKPPAR